MNGGEYKYSAHGFILTNNMTEYIVMYSPCFLYEIISAFHSDRLSVSMGRIFNSVNRLRDDKKTRKINEGNSMKHRILISEDNYDVLLPVLDERFSGP